jgi:hypothetical protein
MDADGKLKSYLLGAVGGAAPGLFLWLFGAPTDIVLGVLVLGVIIGEIIGVAAGGK